MKYKAAIIGCGRIGCGFDDDPKRKTIATHAGAYYSNGNIDLAALADTNQEKLDKYSKKFNVPKTYTDYKKMLATEKPDILSICTWNSTHHEIVAETVKNNIKVIFCEKPISDTITNAKQIVRLCKENNVVLMIDHQRRFDLTHQDVKNFLDQGKLGKIQQVSFYYTAGIANTGSHMFDLLRFLFGDVEWIQAVKSQNQSPNPDDPNLDGIVKFKNGIFCTIQACDVKNYLIFDLDIFGSKARIKLTNSGFTVKYYEAKESNFFLGYNELFESKSPIKEHPKNFMVNAVSQIIDCLEKNTNPLCSGEDGLAALELICAFRGSADNEGKRIYLPLKDSNIKIKSR